MFIPVVSIGVVTLRGQVSARGSADWEKVVGGKLSFDVASVKENKAGLYPSGPVPHSNVPLGPGPVFPSVGGLFSVSNDSLLAYISFAYKLTLDESSSVSPQLPKWAGTAGFDIEARAPKDTTKDEMRLMMQALLADRFKLRTHREIRTVPVFALVLIKPGRLGPQLRPHEDTPPCSSAASTAPGSVDLVEGGFPAVCGGLVPLPETKSGVLRIGARNVSAALIASSFRTPFMGNLERPVVDRTGLGGTLDFTFDWVPELNGPSTSSDDNLGPSFVEALGNELGLKLVTATAPVSMLIIDHVEPPSPN